MARTAKRHIVTGRRRQSGPNRSTSMRSAPRNVTPASSGSRRSRRAKCRAGARGPPPGRRSLRRRWRSALRGGWRRPGGAGAALGTVGARPAASTSGSTPVSASKIADLARCRRPARSSDPAVTFDSVETRATNSFSPTPGFGGQLGQLRGMRAAHPRCVKWTYLSAPSDSTKSTFTSKVSARIRA